MATLLEIKNTVKITKKPTRRKTSPPCMKELVVFFFRRDLRIHDNTALTAALEHCEETDRELLTVFTFDPTQVDPEKNPYYSSNAVQFMVESLVDLHKSVKATTDNNGELLFFRGDSIEFLSDLTKKNNAVRVTDVFYNSDYTPYSLRRDRRLSDWCCERNIRCHCSEDYTLHPINAVKTGGGNAYKVFTPFHRTAAELDVDKPKTTMSSSSVVRKVWTKNTKKIGLSNLESLHSLSSYYDDNPRIVVQGGRDNALRKLADIESKEYKQYGKTRDLPHLSDGTTKMSPYLKFGCVSIREMYWAVRNTYGAHHSLLSQLYWKEFYANVAFHYDHVLRGMTDRNAGNAPMRESLENEKSRKNSVYESVIKWRPITSTSVKNDFERWCRGETGFPIVDAGMRQLNTTGYMHNRLRMITSTFLMKDLHIDWREGERYFATRLVDYDPASNNGGWQWSAGTGTDAQPYFRIFNPWSQAKKFDKDCIYIKKWIPELRDVPPKDILTWYKSFPDYLQNNRRRPAKRPRTNRKTKSTSSEHHHQPVVYYEPMLDHSKTVPITINSVYSALKKKKKNEAPGPQ